MTSLTGSPATLRRRLFGLLAATGLGGITAVALMSAPAAVGASDPCAASEMARAIGNVARSAGDYLDGHPETNQEMTFVMQQPAGPQSVNYLKSYFDANPKVASDIQTIASPLPDACQPSPGTQFHARWPCGRVTRWFAGSRRGGCTRRGSGARPQRGSERFQVVRSDAAGPSSVGVESSRSSGSASFWARNMKKNTAQPIAASSNQLISR